MHVPCERRTRRGFCLWRKHDHDASVVKPINKIINCCAGDLHVWSFDLCESNNTSEDCYNSLRARISSWWFIKTQYREWCVFSPSGNITRPWRDVVWDESESFVRMVHGELIITANSPLLWIDICVHQTWQFLNLWIHCTVQCDAPCLVRSVLNQIWGGVFFLTIFLFFFWRRPVRKGGGWGAIIGRVEEGDGKEEDDGGGSALRRNWKN